MTREEQRKIKSEKLAAKLAAKEEKKQEKKDVKAWDKMVKRLEAKKAWVVGLFICSLLTSFSYGQTDSARLKVTKARSGSDRTYYWLKDIDTKEKYYTVCSCLQKHKEGEIVLVARKDIELFKKD